MVLMFGASSTPRRQASAILWASVVLTVAGLARAGEEAATDNKVFLDGWSYSRERKTITGSNRVTAKVTIKNVTDANLEDVSIAVTYYSGLGEKAGGPLVQKVGLLKPKESKPVQVVGEFIPIFGAYQILVTYRGGKETWAGNSDVGNPEPKMEKPLENAAGVLVLGQEASPDRTNRLSGQVRVKNVGSIEAKNVKLHVTFLGAALPQKKGATGTTANKLGEWTGPLGDGKLGAGVETNVSFTVPIPCPKGFSGFQLSVTCDEISSEQALSGDAFQNSKDVEVAQRSFKRSGAKGEDLEVSCKVRNGLDVSVDQTKVVFTFYAVQKGEKSKVKTHVHEVPGTLKSGEIAPISFTIPKMPNYEACEQEIKFRSGGSGSGDAPNTAALKFKNEQTVEVLLKEFTTGDDGTVMVVCAARNGRPNDVKDVVIKAHFLKSDGGELCVGEKTLPDPMAPGEVRNFVLRAAGAKGYVSCRAEVAFLENKPAPGLSPDRAPGLSGH